MSRSIRLNPELDPRDHAETYARDGMVQIADFLHPDSAEWLVQALEKDTPWGLSVWTPEKGQLLTPTEVATLGRDELNTRVQAALLKARTGFSFVYLAYAIIPALIAGREPGHATHALVEFMNSPGFLDFGKAVTGESGIRKIDAQATWYRPGDFLTLHDDTGPEDERRAAYTLGLARDWRSDWGGQLLFHDAGGDIVRGFKPGFNVWTLFRTPQWHSVAPVAAYAGGKRFSITGWLRDDPPYAEQQGKRD